MGAIPPGMTTQEGAARRLAMTPRQLRGYAQRTALARQRPIALGRGRGAYRFIPQVGVAVLRQARAHLPWHLDAWLATLDDVLRSDEWHAAVQGVVDQLSAGLGPRIGDVAERASLTATQRARMVDLHERSMVAIERHGLTPCIQVEDIIVDRLEDDEDAVVLVGRAQRPFLLPRVRLVDAGITREKQHGVLLLARTGDGVVYDVWATDEVDSTDWRPDPDLFTLVTDVSWMMEGVV